MVEHLGHARGEVDRLAVGRRASIEPKESQFERIFLHWYSSENKKTSFPLRV